MKTRTTSCSCLVPDCASFRGDVLWILLAHASIDQVLERTLVSAAFASASAAKEGRKT